ncbi:alpha/beta hydrolase [Mycobacterium sp. ENV421]|nr:alpha/beta hydrolase [Mycobacterium sp. ENV421]
MGPVTHDLHVHRFGPPGPIRILAIHGLTGHGRRWRALSENHLPEFAMAAPDLIGHGRSSWSAPWTIDANVAALASLLEDDADGPVLVVGHSFGGAIALNLAAAYPDLVSGLVLLDPAIGLDGQWMREIADSMLSSPDYPDRDEARTEKFSGSWADVDPAELDEDLDEHLIELPNGRFGWRICVPAMMSYWSELARDIVLPRTGTPTTLVRAQWTDPPYVSPELLDGLAGRLGDDFTVADFACQHMVSHAKPEETAKVIRDLLEP